MDWFERLTGFSEGSYDETRARLAVEGDRLRSLVNGRHYGIGRLEIPSLQALRDDALSGGVPRGRLKVSVVEGDVRALHRRADYAGASFQVASQFNLLEMVDSDITPEHGVTRYQYDHTQGPACAMAAGAATIYRNYFAPVGAESGQRWNRQIDTLASLGAALGAALDMPVDDLWWMRNGYALCTVAGLSAINGYLGQLNDGQRAALCGHLCVGLHHDVEVTDSDDEPRPRVSQVFCSALPVSYSGLSRAACEDFATLILDAAYEATLWSAALNARRGDSNVVLLTMLGGGAFGNEPTWILGALRRALRLMADVDLDVKIVSRGAPPAELFRLVHEFQ